MAAFFLDVLPTLPAGVLTPFWQRMGLTGGSRLGFTFWCTIDR